MQDFTPSELGPPSQFTMADVRNLFRLAEEKKHLRRLAWWAIFAAIWGWGLAVAGWLR